MELTKKDRVFLINQYRILLKLYPEESAHFEELMEILQNGYEIFYSEIGVWCAEPMSEDAGSLVLDILTFYRFLENYKKNNPDDIEVLDNLWAIFRGFGGNDEGEYYGFTHFLIHKQNKFAEQLKYKEETDDFNSHFPVLDKYRKMLIKWRNFRTESDHTLWDLSSKKFDLSKEEDRSLREEILDILNA